MSFRTMLPSLWHQDEGRNDVFNNLQTEIDRVFDDFKEFFPTSARSNGLRSAALAAMTPRLDLSETEDSIDIEIDLPGVEHSDVDVSLDGRLLTIQGSREAEQKTEKRNYHMVERSQGRFQRTIPLAFDADPDTIKANFTDGVLHVHVVKPPEVANRIRKIEVKETADA